MAGLSLTTLGIYSCKQNNPSGEPGKTDDNALFSLNEVTIDELQKKMESGPGKRRVLSYMAISLS